MHENAYFAKVTNTNSLDLTIKFSFPDALLILTDTDYCVLPPKLFETLCWVHPSQWTRDGTGAMGVIPWAALCQILLPFFPPPELNAPNSLPDPKLSF